MTVASNYLFQAELALAAYADLTGPVSRYKVALEAVGMASSQANLFLSTYTVLTQYSHPTNGLSATVFADAGGNKYLAIRGTDDGYDLASGVINIAILGSTARQAQYASLKAKVTEWLGNGTLSSWFTVTGHSLGGFLATGIAADFAANVSLAYLYNSPVLGGVVGSVLHFSALRSALGIGASTLDSSKVSNIKADAGIRPIAGLGAQVTQSILIANESLPSNLATNNYYWRILA